MTQIDAVFQDGLFVPVNPVSLPENERVRLDVTRTGGIAKQRPHIYTNPDSLTLENWLELAGKLQAEFVAKHGYLPDSTPDIANDRMRGV